MCSCPGICAPRLNGPGHPAVPMLLKASDPCVKVKPDSARFAVPVVVNPVVLPGAGRKSPQRPLHIESLATMLAAARPSNRVVPRFVCQEIPSQAKRHGSETR